jgi:hypothetical protein
MFRQLGPAGSARTSIPPPLRESARIDDERYLQVSDAGKWAAALARETH